MFQGKRQGPDVAGHHFDKNLYLDKRSPDWELYEKRGLIFYDAGLSAVNAKNPTQMVVVDESLADVIAVLQDRALAPAAAAV